MSEWTLGAFRFEYMRDEKRRRGMNSGGMLLKSARIFADSGPAVWEDGEGWVVEGVGFEVVEVYEGEK